MTKEELKVIREEAEVEIIKRLHEIRQIGIALADAVGLNEQRMSISVSEQFLSVFSIVDGAEHKYMICCDYDIEEGKFVERKVCYYEGGESDGENVPAFEGQ